MEKRKRNKEFNLEFGTFIQGRRQKLGWSQADLASKIGNNYQNISRLERGEIAPTLFWCYKLASAFEIDLPDLLTEFGFKIEGSGKT